MENIDTLYKVEVFYFNFLNLCLLINHALMLTRMDNDILQNTLLIFWFINNFYYFATKKLKVNIKNQKVIFNLLLSFVHIFWSIFV